MAIATPKFPIKDLTGILGKVDRSVGRDSAFRLNMSKSPHSTVLSVKTTKTSTRSPAQIVRSATYCGCDCDWKDITLTKRAFLKIYHSQVRQLPTQHMTDYLYWMSLCMAQDWENNLFLLDSYVSRYVIKNDSGGPWISQKVSLINVPILQADGTDVIIVQTTYHRLPITTLAHKIDTIGKVTVCIPDMTAGEIIYIDAYSYGSYSNEQTCI